MGDISRAYHAAGAVPSRSPTRIGGTRPERKSPTPEIGDTDACVVSELATPPVYVDMIIVLTNATPSDRMRPETVFTSKPVSRHRKDDTICHVAIVDICSRRPTGWREHCLRALHVPHKS